MSWIDESFPGAVGKHVQTSDSTSDYNCIAWSLGESHRWWSHYPGYHWPVKRSPLVESLVDVFCALGYVQCEHGELEDGFEKVAVYARNGIWKHAARQLPDGRWASKMGDQEDIEHETAEALTKTGYGLVHCFMKRPTNGKTQPDE